MLNFNNIKELDYDFDKDRKQRCLGYVETVKNPYIFYCDNYKVIIQHQDNNKLVNCVSNALK